MRALTLAFVLFVTLIHAACSDTCTSDANCSGGEVCHATASGTSKCDAPCGDFIECEAGLLCADGRCENREPVGEGEGEGEGEGDVLPTVQNFEASAPVIRAGESVTLTWTTSGDVGLCTVTRELDGTEFPDDDDDDSVTDSPLFDTGYSLLCVGSTTPELFVSVDVASIAVDIEDAEQDRVVADEQVVTINIAPTSHALAPCTVNGVDADANGDAAVPIDDADADGVVDIVGSCATEGGGDPTTDTLRVQVLFSVDVAAGSVTINANEDGIACTINDVAAETDTPVATPSGPATIACEGQRGTATLDVTVP
jgi:hypothetical protein